MPKLSDKYKSLETKLVTLIIEGINTENFIKTVRNGATSYTATPREYPNISIGQEITLQCSKSEMDSWIAKIHPLMEELKDTGIPIRSGSTQYITYKIETDSATKTEYCAIQINVSPIELDRFLEKESIKYKSTGKTYALYKKINNAGLDSFLPFKIIDAISNTIFEKDGYPAAYIVRERGNAFCLACDTNNQSVANAFYDFFLLFEELCKKHNLKLLPGASQYATARTVPNTSIVKYEFNISPADMESLLLLECPKFGGYRGPASISRLLDPDSADIKDGSICLFPALQLADGNYIPRNAGCNMSELISVQLANYIKRYQLSDVEVDKRDFFGHHNSKLTYDILKIDQFVIFSALSKCMNMKGTSHQQEDGMRTLNASDTPDIEIRDLDDDSIRIYQRHAAITYTELMQLKSCEMPIVKFLEILQQVLSKRIDEISKRADAAEKYIQESIAQANEANLKIMELITAIQDHSRKIKPHG